MNNTRRNRLRKIIDKLEKLKDGLDDLLYEEEEYRDNIPENLQGSERYEKSDDACDNISEAVGWIDEAIGCIEAATE